MPALFCFLTALCGRSEEYREDYDRLRSALEKSIEETKFATEKKKSAAAELEAARKKDSETTRYDENQHQMASRILP